MVLYILLYILLISVIIYFIIAFIMWIHADLTPIESSRLDELDRILDGRDEEIRPRHRRVQRQNPQYRLRELAVRAAEEIAERESADQESVGVACLNMRKHLAQIKIDLMRAKRLRERAVVDGDFKAVAHANEIIRKLEEQQAIVTEDYVVCRL